MPDETSLPNAKKSPGKDLYPPPSRHAFRIDKACAGRVEIQREPFRCEEVIAEVIASLAPALAGKTLKMVSDIPAPLPEVWSDRKRIFQIRLNLANNGVKFIEVGEVRIRCVARGAALGFHVTDTGIGIEPENMPLLFEAFRQVDGLARRRYEGRGSGGA